jgi:hypothetical protein
LSLNTEFAARAALRFAIRARISEVATSQAIRLGDTNTRASR